MLIRGIRYPQHHLCIYKSLVRGKLSKFSQQSFCQKLFFLNQTPSSCICSMCLHCIGKVSYCSIKSCGRSWSAHKGTIYAYTKALLGKNCLSSHSCHFVKNYFFWTKHLYAYVGHPISSDNGLISQKLLLKSEFYFPLHVAMGVAYSCMKYGVFIITWPDAIQICKQHCESPWPRKITFFTNFCWG